MEVFKSISPQRLQELLDHIYKDVHGWKAIDVTVEGGASPNAGGVAEKLEGFFTGKEGAIFVCGARKVLTLGRLGENMDMEALKKDINRILPEYQCTVSTGTVTREGLESIAIRLKEVARDGDAETTDVILQKIRRARPERVFFVVDDDMFMRSLVVKVLKPHGRVIEFGDGADLLASYMKEAPEVVFLDIHLPCGSGMDVLDTLTQKDHEASVVILSADRIKENVLLAQARGARGFIAKPFTKEKIEEAMFKCLEQAALMAR